MTTVREAEDATIDPLHGVAASDPFSELLHRLRGEFLAAMPEGHVVLSAGAAGSWYFQWFDEKYPHQIVRHIGFDLGPAPHGLPQNAEWHDASFADLSSIGDLSVDLIFAGQAIEHVSAFDGCSFLIHANRVLKQHGWLVLDSPNFSVTGPIRYLHPEHVIEYTTEQMEEILKLAGFQVVKRKGILLCKSNGRILDDPLNFAKIDDWRIKAAAQRPEDSFIWWLEARRVGAARPEDLSRLLKRFEQSYERERSKFSQVEASASRNGASPVAAGAGFGSRLRRGFRRLPHRLRWFFRAVYRLLTGYYLRNTLRRMDAVSQQVSAYGAQIEAQGEVLDLVLRRTRLLEDGLNGQLAALADRSAAIEASVRSLTEAAPHTLSPATADTLNFDRSHLGFRARFGVWINEPLIYEYTPDEVKWVMTIERIVEVPFVFQALASVPPPARVLDVGSCESLVPLELAALGYKVTAIDVRPYVYRHPNLTAVTASITDWQGDGQAFDAVVLLSTVEHLGLAVYDQRASEERADLQAMDAIRQMLKPGGLLVLTTPFGYSRVDPTQRVYSAADVERLLAGFRVQRCSVARRQDDKTWVMHGALSFADLCQHEPDAESEEAVVLIVAVKD